jgi:hypothetical protein
VINANTVVHASDNTQRKYRLLVSFRKQKESIELHISIVMHHLLKTNLSTSILPSNIDDLWSREWINSTDVPLFGIVLSDWFSRPRMKWKRDKDDSIRYTHLLLTVHRHNATHPCVYRLFNNTFLHTCAIVPSDEQIEQWLVSSEALLTISSVQSSC